MKTFFKYNRQKKTQLLCAQSGGFVAQASAGRLRSARPVAGFTMIELLVAMALFITIMSLVSVIFITSIRSQRGITALIAANDNMFLTLEQMAREMRVGRAFTVSNLPPKISFTDTLGNRLEYTYVVEGESGWIEKSINSGAPQKITADNVNIRNFQIISKGEGISDGFPTRITLVLSVGASGVQSIANVLTNIQTTITVRNLDD